MGGPILSRITKLVPPGGTERGETQAAQASVVRSQSSASLASATSRITKNATEYQRKGEGNFQ